MKGMVKITSERPEIIQNQIDICIKKSFKFFLVNSTLTIYIDCEEKELTECLCNSLYGADVVKGSLFSENTFVDIKYDELRDIFYFDTYYNDFYMR